MTGHDRWVVFDVGETLVDETRVWSAWADVVGVPRLTFMAVLGAVIARGGAHQEVFAALGLDHWERHRDDLEAAYGGFREEDLYPDVRPAMAALRAAGFRLGIFGNQPAHRTAE
ncbi:MAG TPA: haloacid dehalogenase, partial [Candidatus Limnocylindria bacterium]